jgi:hypothetical protein
MLRSDPVYTPSRGNEEFSVSRFVQQAVWCAVAVAIVGGCADRTSQDSASADKASTSAASSAAQGAGTTAAPATTSTSATASHCATATTDTLQSATQLRYGDNIAQPFTVDTILCSGDWARAEIPARSSYPQGAMVLYHYIGEGWRAVQFGSGFSCIPEGVPASIAAELGC